MTSSIIANLERLLGGSRDGALLRYSLGTEWLKAGNPARAAGFFREAIEFDPRRRPCQQRSASRGPGGRAAQRHGDVGPAGRLPGGPPGLGQGR